MFRIEFHRKNQESGFVECGVVTKLEISLCIDGLKKKNKYLPFKFGDFCKFAKWANTVCVNNCDLWLKDSAAESIAHSSRGTNGPKPPTFSMNSLKHVPQSRILPSTGKTLRDNKLCPC
jgi:hypothetical protein